MHGSEALTKVLGYEFETVLDIGSGAGQHAEVFRHFGKRVTTLSLEPPADVIGDYLDTPLSQFDCIWACHVLEHQPNPGLFLKKCFHDLKDGGILAVTVPPAKENIVGGHVTIWCAGILLYQLVLAGFDCSKASVKTYGYNISVVVMKVPADLPPLRMDYGDIETLARFFPPGTVHGSVIREANW